MKVTAILFTSLFVMSSIASSNPIFEDSFESGDLSATNASGFKWGGTNYTSLVTSEGRIFASGKKIDPPDQTDQAIAHRFEEKTGNVALRFRYPAGSNMSEQRFNLGGAYRELWIRYWIRVPVNYTHGTGTPSNQKWMAMWMETYERVGPTVVWGYHRGTDGVSSTISVCHTSTGGCGPYQQTQPFINVPSDRGRWMQIVYQLVASTTDSSNDGIIRFWRRWESESSFTKLHELTNANLPVCETCPSGWHAGYLMGWLNASQSEETQWMLDDFTVSTTNLLEPETNTLTTGIIPPILRIIE